MAITPEECLKLTENEKQQIKDVEKEIDTTLREKYESALSTVELTITIASQRVYNQILSNYRSVGWEVTSRSGVAASGERTLSFKKRSTSNSGYFDR